MATQPDRPIVATKTLCGFFPRATEISPGAVTGVALVDPIAAVKTQLDTSLSKCTLYTPFVIGRAESACFPREIAPPLADDRELRRRAAVRDEVEREVGKRGRLLVPRHLNVELVAVARRCAR